MTLYLNLLFLTAVISPNAAIVMVEELDNERRGRASKFHWNPQATYPPGAPRSICHTLDLSSEVLSNDPAFFVSLTLEG